MSKQPDAPESFKYFTLGSSNPVRVRFNDAGERVKAETPDPETGGFKNRTTLLSRLAESPDAEEIDRGTFERLCDTIYAKKKSEHGGLSL